MKQIIDKWYISRGKRLRADGPHRPGGVMIYEEALLLYHDHDSPEPGGALYIDQKCICGEEPPKELLDFLQLFNYDPNLLNI